MTTQFLTRELREALLEAGRKTRQGLDDDPVPLVKLFLPDGPATWLLCELDPDDEDIAFGLCDLGLGEPELGSVSICELDRLRGPLGLPVERDTSFKALHPISTYADLAIEAGRILA